MLNIAVIGLGDVSIVHLPAIQNNPNAKLVAICDVDASKASVADARFYTDYEVMLEEETIDCVHICLPHYLHYPVAKVCAKKRVHVFLEKPLAHTLEAAQQLAALEHTYPGVKLGICYQNRLNATSEHLYKIVKDGQYGRILGMKGIVAWYRPAAYYAEKPWRSKMATAGGGVMINQAIHTIDLMQYLGGDIQSIKGTIDCLSDYAIEVEDTATAKMNFKQGFTGLFFSTITNSRNASIELEVIFEEATFTIKDSLLTQTNAQGKTTVLVEDETLPGTKSYYGASHEKLIHRFHTAIQDKTDHYIPVSEGVTAMKIIDAIRTSSASHQKVAF